MKCIPIGKQKVVLFPKFKKNQMKATVKYPNNVALPHEL
jgi:hypothetical protein